MREPEITIRTEPRPGDLGRLIALHGEVYGDEEGGFGLAFEAFVARTVADFVLREGGDGRFWFAEVGDALVATAAMVIHDNSAGRPSGQLRWVVAAPVARGRGLGGRLIVSAIDYARARNCADVYLETTDGLDASMAIYKRLGFVERDRSIETMWRQAPKITMALDLDASQSV